MLCVAIGTAMAGIPWGKAFEKQYTPKKDSKIVKAKCSLCHTKGKVLNPYGLDLEKAAKGSKTPTAATYKAVENLDSDKDGVKNVDEIKKDTLPGDPKSK